jgi:hypothetical protein
MGSQIVIPVHVEQQLIRLYDLLYRQGYFSYKENALNYVNGIREFIKQIPNLPKRPLKDKKFGQYFRKYVPNRKTTWFISFEEENGKYLITYITNNHSDDYDLFIRAIS